jgi:hypothetical protein
LQDQLNINELRTYRLFKNSISLEPYVSMKNDEQRILLSKLRISNESWFMMKLSSLDINHINCSLISKCLKL